MQPFKVAACSLLPILFCGAHIANGQSNGAVSGNLDPHTCDCSEGDKGCRGKMISDRHDIEGYAEKSSVLPGETIKVFVHARFGHQFTAKIFRFDQDFVSQRPTAAGQPLLTISGTGIQRTYSPDAFSNGAEWESTTDPERHGWFTIRVDKNWRAGLYLVELQDSNSPPYRVSPTVFYVPFAVRSDQKKQPQVAVILSTNTWQAYNSWSGHSFYINTCSAAKKNVPPENGLSYNRPNVFVDDEVKFSLYNHPWPYCYSDPRSDEICFPYNAHLDHGPFADRFILDWLDVNNVCYDLLTDEDFDSNQKLDLSHFKVVVLDAHPEYPTAHIEDALRTHLENKKSIIVLGGNAFARAAEPIPGHRAILDLPDTNSKKAVLLGLQDGNAGNTCSPYEIQKLPDDLRWLLKRPGGKAIAAGDTIGAFGLNVGDCGDNDTGAAAGHEVDKTGGSNATVIAHSANTSANADMVYYKPKFGGRVFSAGSITFSGTLVCDSNISQIVWNVLISFLDHPPGWHEAPTLPVRSCQDNREY